MESIDHIINALEHYLGEHPCCTEHDLIRHLKDQALEPFTVFNLSNNGNLFSAHFLTKHSLYILQNRLLDAKRYCLTINSVQIRLEPYSFGLASMIQYDTVKAYYLDIRHYFETSEREVDALLGSFWKRFLAQDDKQLALETLGLEMDADYPSIKRAYRSLAQKHHPDKGGDTRTFVELNAAKTLLDRIYL